MFRSSASALAAKSCARCIAQTCATQWGERLVREPLSSLARRRPSIGRAVQKSKQLRSETGGDPGFSKSRNYCPGWVLMRESRAVDGHCAHCGAPFHIPAGSKGGAYKRRFCSPQCSYVHWTRAKGVRPMALVRAEGRERTRRTCANCSTMFYGDTDRATYCSRECYFIARKAAGASYQRKSPRPAPEPHAQ